MRANDKGHGGAQAHTLADLRRLRKQAMAAAAQGAAPGDHAGAAPEPARPATEKPRKPAVKAGGGNPDHGVSAPDHALFRRAVKSVQPIKDSRRAILPAAPQASSAMLRERRARAVGAAPGRPLQISDHYRPAQAEQDDANFVRPGYGPDLVKGLKRGKWLIGASLDLHGNTLEEARGRLDGFLQSCLAHRVKCVRIVHGKGYGSKNGEPVLKQTVRRWLTQMTAVLAYAECSDQDGGAGAVQVLLQVERAEAASQG